MTDLNNMTDTKLPEDIEGALKSAFVTFKTECDTNFARVERIRDSFSAQEDSIHSHMKDNPRIKKHKRAKYGIEGKHGIEFEIAVDNLTREDLKELKGQQKLIALKGLKRLVEMNQATLQELEELEKTEEPEELVLPVLPVLPEEIEEMEEMEEREELEHRIESTSAVEALQVLDEKLNRALENVYLDKLDILYACLWENGDVSDVEETRWRFEDEAEQREEYEEEQREEYEEGREVFLESFLPERNLLTLFEAPPSSNPAKAESISEVKRDFEIYFIWSNDIESSLDTFKQAFDPLRELNSKINIINALLLKLELKLDSLN